MLNKTAWPSEWLLPRWPAPPRVRAVMTICAGGVSGGLFASMNLGEHVGDEPAAVAANRARLAELIGASPVFMRQVHGSEVARLDSPRAVPQGCSPHPDPLPEGKVEKWGPEFLPLLLGEGRGEGMRSAGLNPVPSGPVIQADGAFTLEPGLACTVMVADCLPILLTHERVPVVAALHAGWRGLAGQGGQGIVEAGWAQLQAATGLDEAELSSGLMAWLGPCIGPQAFEVGAEVREAFVQDMPEAVFCFRPGQGAKLLADLPQLARLRLARLGIHRTYGNDGSSAWCTVAQSGFFSHRRVSGRPGARPGDTGGRMAACIWLD